MMRDGVRLNTLVILPPEKSKLGVPSILIRTPYKTEFSWSSALYQELLHQGYAIIMQHERGRYFSEGEFRMLGGALEDGWDTLDWIVSQPWSNGDVGTFGCSSSGENQLKLATASHPAHKAMVAGSVGVGVAEAGPFQEQGNFWRGGVWQQGWMNYFYASMHQDWPQLPRGLSNEERQRTIGFFDLSNAGWKVPSSTFNKTRMHLPMVDIMNQLNAPRNELEQYLMRGPAHESWSELRVSEGDMITVPGLYFESLYDISSRSSLAYFEWNRQANQKQGRNNQQLRLTQGGHCSFGRGTVENEQAKIGDLALGDMRYDYVKQTIDWFNRWMKPSTHQTPLGDAYTAFLGDGQWLHTNTLPMKGDQQWQLSANGQLTQASLKGTHSLSYDYDPADPVPSLGGEIYGEGDDHNDGSFDQAPIQERDDVLVFTSDAVHSDLTLFGMTEVLLSVSSNQPDTDFTVKINDLYPDGRAFNIGNTIMRMRYREGVEREVFMQKGEIYNIVLPPIMLSRIIKKGHRIQVEVSSSNFPSYSRNLNTAENPYTSTEFAVATNTIHFGAGHQSMIRLPVHNEPSR
ncbi:CocE/NonD family hydrolase [Aliiglaciecola litoralis]|uniref:CocE/NonD family hydrolase n=1 Tax=Aliiglaciecola litoralis TaxID=582857 RepID=A0ABN1LQ44_9ALTE